MRYPIGIDLGTSNSVVAVYRDVYEVIANDQGLRTTPSYVAFTETEILVGIAAVNQATHNPENTIYGIKRFIGRNFNDPEVQQCMNTMPYDVVEIDGRLKIRVKYLKQIKYFTPEEISSNIIEYLKKCAEEYLGHEVFEVVITIPAHFNDAQRSATIEAGKLAGFEESKIKCINEPTAAAVAYGYNEITYQNPSGTFNKKILIFDLGGGTFDVSIVKIIGPQITVLAKGGDSHLGGEDIDNTLCNYFIEKFNSENIYENDHLSKQMLKKKCRELKQSLSAGNNANLYMEGYNLKSEISRAKFDELNYELYQKTIDVTKNTLKEANLNITDIDDFILVGGSTRILKLQQELKQVFGRDPKKNINADEAVAIGAAIHAYIKFSDSRIIDSKKTIKIVETCPFTISTDIANGEVDVLFRRNTPIPCSTTKIYETIDGRQTIINLRLYEGEGKLQKDNKLVGDYFISEIPKTWFNRKTKITCTFSINENGCIEVSAQVQNKSKNLKIELNRGSTNVC